MKCQLCGERDASIHYIEIVEGQKASQWICTDCAEKEGIATAEVSKLMHGSLDAVLGDMLSSASGEKTREKTKGQPVCDVCGFEYDLLQQKGRLGCPACYAAFRRQLLPVLRRFHGDTHHIGKSPKSRGPQAALRREIAQLKLLLEQAIAQEVYEEAARLRDRIRDKERQVGLLGRDEDAVPLADESPPSPSDDTESKG